MKQIVYNPKEYRIEFHFPFDLKTKNRVKAIPSSVFDPDDRIWYLPASDYHARMAIQFAQENDFHVSPELSKMGRETIVHRNPSLRKLLRPYQIAGVEFLHAAGGRAIIGDDMGIGKTFTALAYIFESGFARTLVVCPASVTWNWKNEVEKWLPGWTSTVITGYNTPIETDHRILITSYNVFTNRVHELNDMRFDCMIADESHYLANEKASRTQAAKLMIVPHFIALSGTPFLNKPIELYPQLNILSPAVFNNFWSFGRKYADGKKDWGGHWVFNGASNIPELKSKLAYLMLRRTKAEVLTELPPIQRTYYPVDNTSQTLHSEYLNEIKQLRLTWMTTKGTALSKIAGARQLVGLMKIPHAVEMAEIALKSADKIVLFCHHKEVVSQISKALESYGLIKIVGDTPQQDRFDLVNKFTNDPNIHIAIISLAGGEGINLQAASTLIFVERAWNPGKESQIEGRLHRIGQAGSVNVIYLILRGTIDDKIHRIIERKRVIFNDLIGLDDIPTNEWLEILQ